MIKQISTAYMNSTDRLACQKEAGYGSGAAEDSSSETWRRVFVFSDCLTLIMKALQSFEMSGRSNQKTNVMSHKTRSEVIKCVFYDRKPDI
jgi:hypothetical protein